MHFIVVNYSVIMTMIWIVSSDSSDIKDFSDLCTNGESIQTHLTTGSDSNDYSIGIIANDGKLNCSLNYTVRENNFIMLVVEFPDWKPGSKLCTRNENTVLVVSGNKKINICNQDDDNVTKCYRHLAKDAISLDIKSMSDMNTIKVTATSLRYTSDATCQENTEIKCIYSLDVYCMTSHCVCDGNANCGVRGAFDEDEYTCQDSKLTAIVVILSMIMLTISFFLFVSITLFLIPKRKGTFIYKLDQTMSLFDREGNFGDSEIFVKTVFPKEFNDEFQLKKKEGGETSRRLRKKSSLSPSKSIQAK